MWTPFLVDPTLEEKRPRRIGRHGVAEGVSLLQNQKRKQKSFMYNYKHDGGVGYGYVIVGAGLASSSKLGGESGGVGLLDELLMSPAIVSPSAPLPPPLPPPARLSELPEHLRVCVRGTSS